LCAIVFFSAAIVLRSLCSSVEVPETSFCFFTFV